MRDPELFYDGEGGIGYDGPEIEEEEIPEDEEFQEEEEVEEDDGWMQGWHPSRNKPENLCRYLRGLGLCTVFPYGNAYKLVVGGQFYGPFPTREDAQFEADRFATPAPADSPGDKEENTAMSEANSNAAQQQEAPQYVTKARFDRLVAYVQELVTEHNRLDARVVELERHEENRQPELTTAIRQVHEASLCFQDALSNSAAAEVKAQ